MSGAVILSNRRDSRHRWWPRLRMMHSLWKKKGTCFILQVSIVRLRRLGICVLVKLSYYLVNGHHAMLADGHKECQKHGPCIIFWALVSRNVWYFKCRFVACYIPGENIGVHRGPSRVSSHPEGQKLMLWFALLIVLFPLGFILITKNFFQRKKKRC